MRSMKAKRTWLGVGIWMAAAIAWGAEGLWLGSDDRVAVVSKSAGAEWAEAAGVLLECVELEIPLAVFHGVLTEEERAAEMEAFPVEGEEDERVRETGADFETLGAQLADFDPSHVILAGWKAGEGIPFGLAEALEETPAMILQTVASKGDYTMSLADFQREMRNLLLPAFGLAASRKSAEHFRRMKADDFSTPAEEEKPVPEVSDRSVAPGQERRVEEEGPRESLERRREVNLKPRTKLPDAAKPTSWFDRPASW